MKSILLLISALILTVCESSFANEYAKGNGALEIFDAEGISASPTWVKVWIGFMATSFIVGIFFVKNHTIARWIVGGFAIGFLITSLAGQLGIIVLSGFIACVHIICWSPALYQLLTTRPFLIKGSSRSAFSIWSGIMTFVILFSFVFDIRDAYIYLAHIM